MKCHFFPFFFTLDALTDKTLPINPGWTKLNNDTLAVPFSILKKMLKFIAKTEHVACASM